MNQTGLENLESRIDPEGNEFFYSNTQVIACIQSDGGVGFDDFGIQISDEIKQAIINQAIEKQRNFLPDEIVNGIVLEGSLDTFHLEDMREEDGVRLYTLSNDRKYESIVIDEDYNIVEMNKNQEQFIENEIPQEVMQNGYVTKDVEIEAAINKEGEPFSVANFAIAYENLKGETEYRNISAYGNNVQKVSSLKKGDFIHVQGVEKSYTSKNGRENSFIQLSECELLEASKKQEFVSYKGNVVGEPEHTQIQGKDGNPVPVVNFSIVYSNEKKDTVFQNISAYGKKAEKVKNLKKGDFVLVQGTEKNYVNKNGKDRTSIRMTGHKLLKSREDRMRDKSEKQKENTKQQEKSQKNQDTMER